MPDTSAHTSKKPFEPAQVLVADDDPGSRRFLGDGLDALGAKVHTCNDGAAAIARARSCRFDLLLLDCRMPGAGALQILNSLRTDHRACSNDSVAVATSANLEPVERQALLQAGFSDILLKPCTVADLRHMLELVQSDPAAETGVLDDSAGLSASGNAATMQALRQLLGEELAHLSQELDQLSRDRVGFSERLHRLRSSCGFCGAVALSNQTVALQQQLQRGSNIPMTALTRFRQTLMDTMQALVQPAGGEPR